MCEFGISFWNKSANEINFGSEEGRNSNIDKSNMELEKPKTRRASSLEIFPVEKK